MDVITNNDIARAPLLPITIEGHAFMPNTEGLWSLTEINKVLPELTKPPAQWRGRERDYFERCANLHSVNGDQGGTWATERAAIAYAMACSLDFYVMVLDAFVTMRNDSILSARMAALALVEKEQLLADNMPKADALMQKARTYGVSWSEACRAAKILRPVLAKDYLLSVGKFRKEFDHDQGKEIVRPVPLGFQRGYFKRHTGQFGNADGWKVSATGIVWLQGKASEINQKVVEMRARKEKAKRQASSQRR